MTDEEYMQIALNEAYKSMLEGEVPVGAIIVKDGNIIASSGNLKERSLISTRHAEMEVLEKAMRLGDKYLYDCTLYVTLEPCPMCAGAMINSRLKRLVFGAYDKKAGCAGSVYDLLGEGQFNHKVIVKGGVLADECGNILSSFFKAKRGNK